MISALENGLLRRSHTWLRLCAITIFWLPTIGRPESTSETASRRDLEVFTTVLTHFAARKDTWPANPGGYIAVEPMTPGTDWLLTGLLQPGWLRKISSPDTVADLARRNLRPEPIPADIAQAAGMRVQSAQEAGDFLYGGNREIATLITPYLPGYSADGQQAVVVLSFNWSIHTGYVIYLLRLTNDRWTVSMSRLDAFL